MAFTINKTDGTVLATISDGTVDNTTELALIGKNYAGYGELLNENQVKLLENFANTEANAPTKAIAGQLFYNTTASQLQVYDGSAFKTVSGSIVNTTQPTSAVSGDIWFDSTNNQMYAYNGTTWVLIGPAAASGEGQSGAIVTTISDTGGTLRPVVQMTTSDVIVAIASNTEFTPASSVTGFATIKKGITLSSNISSNKFQGIATDSDSLGGIAAANYLRSNADDTTVGTLTVQNDDSLVLGADGDFTITQSGDHTTLKNVTSDGDILFNVNDGGSDLTALTITGSNRNVTVATNLTVTGDLSVLGTTQTITATQTTIADPFIVLNQGASSPDNDIGIMFDRGGSNVAIMWDESADEFAMINTSDSGGTYGDIGIDSYATLRVTATTAQYADLAERYEADEPMEYGDVVRIGGEKEITKTTEQADPEVFGVISKDPAYKMNAGAGNDKTHPYVALTGRAPCKVKGPVKKGQYIVSSDEPGIAIGIDGRPVKVYSILGRSLQDSNEQNVKYIEITVGKF